MKRFKLTFVLTVLMSMVGQHAFADWDTSNRVQVDGLYYYLDNDNNVAQVTSNSYTGDITIPSSFTYNNTNYSVTSIGEKAFFWCRGLTSITIPNSVTSIGRYAFSDCPSLTSLTIGNSVTSIGDYAFYSCSSLTSITIPNSVTSIGSVTFANCSGLTDITIPNRVTSIGDYAFYGCSGLTSATIGNNVTSIGKYSFYECSGLTDITIPNRVTSIGDYAFYKCSGLTTATIDNNVTSIGEYAFGECSKLTTVTLNSNTVASKTYTESNNKKNIFGKQVEEYIIGNDVTSIGKYAFFGCSDLTYVVIGNRVTSIGSNAFDGCSSLSFVVISDIEKWSQISFENSSANPLYYAKNLYLNYEISNYEMYYKEVTKLNLANDVSSYAFINCKGLTEVDVKGVGTDAFKGCPNITSIKVDCETVDNWFADSKAKVQTLTLGESVTTINANSFDGFNALKKVYLGSNLAAIGAQAFANCGNMVDVYCYASRYPNVQRNTFENSYIDYVTLHVPAESVSHYKNHEVWGKFKDVVPLSGEETDIERVTTTSGIDSAPVIYNMNGQRITKPQKGLNIINGRKVLIK